VSKRLEAGFVLEIGGHWFISPSTLKSMKKNISTIVGSAIVIALASCAAPAGPNTQRGAATGALLGAAAGGIIGHQSGRGLEGAAIGAAGGGTAGALYGNARDQEQYGRY
jgi:YMGG-like Gly-zipper